MKTISIKEITMTNFKGLDRTTKFNSVGSTTISGDNGIGKSRHFDAFLWLLFGKDSQDRKDYEIRTKVNGQLLHKVECSVSAIITVDGEDITLKRSYVERWVKPRGQAEEVFKGNITECTWNDVPVNVTEYDKRIASIIDGTVFKMITNPHFFTSMKWEEQREQLFNMIDTVSDDDIASTNPKFKALLDSISGKSLSDFKKELAATKKRLKDELIQINPRIDQTYKMMPEKKDYADIESKMSDIDNQIKEIDKSVADEEEKSKSVISKRSELNDKILNLNRKLESECYDKNAEISKSNREKTEELNNKAREIDSELNKISFELQSDKERKESLEYRKNETKKEVDELRNKWIEISKTSYTESDKCPTCGQTLPDDMILKSKELFESNKKKELDSINDQGKRGAAILKDATATLEKVNKDIEEDEKKLSDITKKKEELQKEEDSYLKQSRNNISISKEDLPDYAEINAQIEELSKELDDCKVFTNQSLTAKRNDLLDSKKELELQLKTKDDIKRSENEIDNLKERGKQLSQQIADLEKQEFTVRDFTKAKIDTCETKINSLFKITRFKLFDYTLDGNPVETCKALDNSGVPYDTTNTAQQVNMGIDIINALSKYYGVSAPIFIDRRESVNNLIDTQSQIINLVVTKDKELIVK